VCLLFCEGVCKAVGSARTGNFLLLDDVPCDCWRLWNYHVSRGDVSFFLDLFRRKVPIWSLDKTPGQCNTPSLRHIQIQSTKVRSNRKPLRKISVEVYACMPWEGQCYGHIGYSRPSDEFRYLSPRGLRPVATLANWQNASAILFNSFRHVIFHKYRGFVGLCTWCVTGLDVFHFWWEIDDESSRVGFQGNATPGTHYTLYTVIYYTSLYTAFVHAGPMYDAHINKVE